MLHYVLPTRLCFWVELWHARHLPDVSIHRTQYDLRVILVHFRIPRRIAASTGMKQRRTKATIEPPTDSQLGSLGLRLQNLRQLQNTTQLSLAKQLGIGQTALSHMERRDDILLSTLKAYIEALGGQLHVAASLPNTETIALIGDAQWQLRQPPPNATEQSESAQLSLPTIPGPKH